MSFDPNDDSLCWESARAGDGAAFAVLFRRHRSRVYTRALTLVAHVHGAEDITAAAFFELWRKRRSVRTVEGSVLPWLLVTVVNLAKNQRRAASRYRHLVESLPREGTADAESIAVTNVHTELLGVRLTDAIGRLSAEDAALLVLTALDELSIADAAAAIGIKPGAARMRLHRARHRLQADLVDERPHHNHPISEGEHA
jgi:RNA polymerase sigma factor (sigma-70 family)